MSRWNCCGRSGSGQSGRLQVRRLLEGEPVAGAGDHDPVVAGVALAPPCRAGRRRSVARACGVGRVDDDGVQLTDHGPILAGRPAPRQPDPGRAAPGSGHAGLARPPGRRAEVGAAGSGAAAPDARPPARLADLAARRRAPRPARRRRSPRRCPLLAGPAWVAEIDDDLADTAAFTEAYAVPLEASANCVVVAARRARADHAGRLRRPGHHPGRRQRAGPPAPRRPQGLVRAAGRRGRRDGDGLRRHHAGRAARGLAGARRPGGGGRRTGSSSARAPGAASWPCPAPCWPRCRPPRCSTGSGQPLPSRRRAGAGAAAGAAGRRTTATSAGASGPAEPADDDRRYLEDRPPHWGSD